MLAQIVAMETPLDNRKNKCMYILGEMHSDATLPKLVPVLHGGFNEAGQCDLSEVKFRGPVRAMWFCIIIFEFCC